MSGDGVEVFVRGEDGEAHPMSICEKDTLQDVKVKVAEVLKFDKDVARQLSLEHMQEEVCLNDDELFSSLGVAAGDDITVKILDDPDYEGPDVQFDKVVTILADPRSFSTQGEADSLPAPTLSIGNHVLGWPLSPEQKDALLKLDTCHQRCPGCHVFKADALSFGNPSWHKKMKRFLAKHCPELGVGSNMEARLQELVIYEQGPHSRPKEDRDERAKKGFLGTLVLAMPSVHAGGDAVLRYGNKEEKVAGGKGKGHGLLAPYYAAFYDGSTVDISAVTSGHKVELVYDIKYTGKGDVPFPTSQDAAVYKLMELERLWVERDPKILKVGYLLDGTYAKTPTWDELVGQDLALTIALRSTGVFDMCIVKPVFSAELESRYDDGDIEEVSFDKWEGTPLFPPGAEFVDDLKDRVTKMRLDTDFCSGLEDRIMNEMGTSSACDRDYGRYDHYDRYGYHDDIVHEEYSYPVLLLWPKRLRLGFLGAAAPAMLLEMLNDGNEDDVVGVIGCSNIGTFFATCAEANNFSSTEEIKAANYLLSAAVHPQVPLQVAADFIRRVPIRRVSHDQLTAFFEALLPKGEIIKAVFTECIKTACKKSDKSVEAAARLVERLWDTGADDRDDELLKQAAGAIVASFKRPPHKHKDKPSLMTSDNDFEKLLIAVLRVATKLGLNREHVLVEALKNTKRYVPSRIAGVEMALETSAEAQVVIKAVIRGLKEGKEQLTHHGAASVLRLVGRSGQADKVLHVLCKIPVISNTYTRFLKGILYGSGSADDVLRTQIVSDTTWARQMVAMCHNETSLVTVIECLKKFEDASDGKEEWQLQAVKRKDVGDKLDRDAKNTLVLAEKLQDTACAGGDAHILILENVIRKIEENPVPKVKDWSMNVGVANGSNRCSGCCICSSVESFMRSPTETQKTVSQRSRCFTNIKQKLKLTKHGMGFTSPFVTVEPTGNVSALLTKKVAGAGSPDAVRAWNEYKKDLAVVARLKVLRDKHLANQAARKRKSDDTDETNEPASKKPRQ